MGGELLLGLRNKEGKEKLQLRWTNPIPFIMATPSFLEGGKLFKEIWNEKTAKQGWPGTRVVKRISPSEYGVVFVDLKERIIFSRQDYCTPTMLHAQGSIDAEFAEILLAQHTLKRVKKLTLMERKSKKGNPYRELKKAEKDRLFRALKKGLSLIARNDGLWQGIKLSDYIQLEWAPKGFKLDYGDHARNSRARYCWPEVKAFLKKYGWKSPHTKGR